jgi:putative Mg2+ transporter-C (MgtC) family protein
MTPLNEILLKLGLALVLGGAIGIERETSQKPAGLRTNVLICLTSAMMMILAEMFAGKNGTGADGVTRIAAGIITGVGFLGAGAILQSRGSVHGLTTASVIWAVAGLGIVVGAGYYAAAAIFTAVVVLTLIALRKVDKVLNRKGSGRPHNNEL